jgi:glutamine amidotransferase
MAYLREHGLDTLNKNRPSSAGHLHRFTADVPSFERVNGLPGYFRSEVKRFQPQRHEDRCHIGLEHPDCVQSPLFEGVGVGDYVYYVHSYYAVLSGQTIATTTTCIHTVQP